MRHKMLACAVLSLGFPLASQAASPSVAVDIAPLHSLVSQVMDGAGKPDLLIPAEASPHEYTLRPSQARALSDAQIVFWIGEELTPWLEKAMDNVADSAQKVAMLELDATTKYAFREGATFEGHDHHEEEAHHDEEHHEDDEHAENKHDDHGEEEHAKDEHHDDDHSEDKHAENAHHDEHHHDGVDPHAWLDPENAKAWITEIKGVLSKHDPDNAEVYESNAKKAIASLNDLIESARVEVDSLGELRFVVFHDAYQYFEKRLGISAVGSISLGDAEDPSPARVEEIRATVKKLGVACVFTEPQYNPGLVYSVFEGTSVSAIGVMDPLGAALQPGSQHYPELIKGMVKSLSQCKT